MGKQPFIIEIETWCAENYQLFTPGDIKLAVNKVFGLEKEAMRLKDRKAILAEARKCYCWFSSRLTSVDKTLIGFKISRDYFTIIKAIDKANDLLDAGDEMFSNNIKKVFTELKQYEKV